MQMESGGGDWVEIDGDDGHGDEDGKSWESGAGAFHSASQVAVPTKCASLQSHWWRSFLYF